MIRNLGYIVTFEDVEQELERITIKAHPGTPDRALKGQLSTLRALLKFCPNSIAVESGATAISEGYGIMEWLRLTVYPAMTQNRTPELLDILENWEQQFDTLWPQAALAIKQGAPICVVGEAVYTIVTREFSTQSNDQ